MLNNWLSSVSDNKVSSYFSNTFYEQDSFPNLENAKLVFFSSESDFTNLIRHKLNSFHNHFQSTFIDIGTLNTNNSSSIYQVISDLQDGFIIPVLIGVDQTNFFDFCQAMKLENKIDIAANISNSAMIPKGDYCIENIGFQRHLLPKYVFEEIIEK